MSARSFRVLVVLLVALGMLSGATAALADDPDYPPVVPDPDPDPGPDELPEVEEELEEEQVPEGPEVDEDISTVGVSLPRTGTSVVILALLGAALVGLGTVLVARRRSPGEPA